jgi:hypothetical protein
VTAARGAIVKFTGLRSAHVHRVMPYNETPLAAIQQLENRNAASAVERAY